MKKLQLNKQTIARLNNPDGIYGGAGDGKVPLSYDGNYRVKPTCFICNPINETDGCTDFTAPSGGFGAAC
ncbi:MAG: class I lanthipeptide [Bacteroidetes bacterium]|nr:class I lanthipeptide [Bacteroidota bacterium]MCL2302429.1 class I lanthipeptide [Lentimicrobiaceae bacterium]